MTNPVENVSVSTAKRAPAAAAAVICGDTEVANGEVSIKNLAKHEQSNVSMDGLVDAILQMIAH